ncbi:MAG TPA: tRNA adenosine(34) deaminase TadA [Candidatus Limiplasma sp.]|jgi:tRNA(adenine34) deaminase|nr:tRNA adenosine(34) deaminase TadA [Candidatus Limiplasma sp.]HPR76961.1 tRNA adenosine(34) deaminase TadA [Candidatus Limiplasma sp.]
MSAHERFMRMALAEAQQAAQEGEIPVGAVLVMNGEVIASAHNRREQLHDPTAHAEILVLRAGAEKLKDRRLSQCTLYTTLEPCPMCAGAMVMAKLGACIFGASDERQGCCGSVYALTRDPSFYWRLSSTGGLLVEESQALLNTFFARRRQDD